MAMKDLTGMRFGKLTVLGLDKSRKRAYGTWMCRCDCGNTISVVGHRLTRGDRRTCGCRKGTSETANTLCLRCGEPTSKPGLKYCSRACAAQARFHKDGNQKMEPMSRRPVQCLYQPEVFCQRRECDRCGWNPDVAKERLERYGKSL